MFPGRDIRAHNDEKLHNHGTSTIKHGRGSVLTVDLTNRCNMMCDPCFMDANQVGFVHELTLGRHQDDARQRHHDQAAAPDVGAVLRRRADAFALLPGCRRATPARSATTACRPRPTASSSPRARNSPQQAAEAGLRYAYLQFDGIGNAANAHREVGNLFDVKLQAIENLHTAGVDIVPVITIVNGINNEQVGRIIEFALDNPKKIGFLSFQPVSFTGRDEEITDGTPRGAALHAVAPGARREEPDRDGRARPATGSRFRFMGTFTDWADLVHGPEHSGATSTAAVTPTAASAWPS